MELLRRFNGDVHTKEAVINFVVGFLEDRIIEEAKKGNEVKHIASAINEIIKSFDQLDIQYAIKQQDTESVNEAA